jgi:hypothetical protein
VFKKVPDVFVIVFGLIVLAAILTWVLPGGRYERTEKVVNGVAREVVDPESYTTEASNPQSLGIFTAPVKGFLRLSDIIAFIFLVGGSFFVLNETGAITAGIHKMVKALKGKEFLIIPAVMLVFSVFGAAFGMCEEAIPFALIFVPMAIALGYDSLVGVSLTFLAAGVGFAGAFLNPFTLQIAQGLAGVQTVSGWQYRVVVWAISTAVTIAWVMIYAARIKKDPKRSIMYDIDQARREEIEAQQAEVGDFTWRHGVVLSVLAAVIVLMVVGVVRWEWFIVEIAGLFVAMGVVAGALSGMDPNRLAKAFLEGCRDIAGAALIVGFAGGIPRDPGGRQHHGHPAPRGGNRDGQPAAAGVGVDHVRRPARPELLHPFGIDQSGSDHAAHGAAGGPVGHHPADGRARLPVRRRIHQHDHPHVGGDRRYPGPGQDPLREVVPLESAHAGHVHRHVPGVSRLAGDDRVAVILRSALLYSLWAFSEPRE